MYKTVQKIKQRNKEQQLQLLQSWKINNSMGSTRKKLNIGLKKLKENNYLLAHFCCIKIIFTECTTLIKSENGFAIVFRLLCKYKG